MRAQLNFDSRNSVIRTFNESSMNDLIGACDIMALKAFIWQWLKRLLISPVA